MTAVIDRTNHTQYPDNKKLGHIPGDLGYPVIGRLPIMLKEGVRALAVDQYQRFGAVSLCSPGAGINTVMVLGPDHVQRLLLDKDKEFSVEMGYDKPLTTFFGRGVLTYDFEEHKIQRRILQTGFKTPAMRGYVETMLPIIDEGITQQWSYDNFEFFPNIKQLLLDVAGEVFFGTRSGSEENKVLVQAFLDILDGQMGLIKWDVPGFKFHKGMQGRRTVEASIRGLLPGRRGSDKSDMLTFMCNATKDDGSYFSEQEIIEHANFLLFAAHDTTTSALSHLMYYLAREPGWQERLRQECIGLGTDAPTYDDLDSLQLCEQAFKEAIRLHPSVPIMMRRTTKDVEFDGFRVPACTLVSTVPSFSHYMSEYWTKPEQFDPERFSTERAEHKSHSMAFMAFGGGGHKCIGMHFAIMNAKLFLTQFLSRYRFTLAPNASHKMNSIPLPRPADGVRLIVEPL